MYRIVLYRGVLLKIRYSTVVLQLYRRSITAVLLNLVFTYSCFIEYCCFEIEVLEYCSTHKRLKGTSSQDRYEHGYEYLMHEYAPRPAAPREL
jgi:hypothetical protein